MVSLSNDESFFLLFFIYKYVAVVVGAVDFRITTLSMEVDWKECAMNFVEKNFSTTQKQT